MGLLITDYETKHGVVLESAYLKFCSGTIVSWHSPKRSYFDFDVDVFASIEAREAGKPRLESLNFNMRLNTDGDADQYNVIKQAYNYLATLEQYDEARDV